MQRSFQCRSAVAERSGEQPKNCCFFFVFFFISVVLTGQLLAAVQHSRPVESQNKGATGLQMLLPSVEANYSQTDCNKMGETIKD